MLRAELIQLMDNGCAVGNELHDILIRCSIKFFSRHGMDGKEFGPLYSGCRVSQ